MICHYLERFFLRFLDLKKNFQNCRIKIFECLSKFSIK